MKTTPITRAGIDIPLNNPRSDCLNREVFAKRIFKIIDGTPIDSHMRVGIYGSWGEGKTTVLNFLKWFCEKAGHPVALFNPWQFHCREDAWQGLVSSIDTGLAKWNHKLVGNFKRKKIIKDISGKARSLAEIAGTKVGKAIGELILAPLEGLLEATKEKVNTELIKVLKDKRLYVFVDDLDRAEPEIIYDSLMLLNEVFDLNRCIFVIALDVQVASDLLRHKLGFIESKEFFNKIVNWPFELPVPSHFDWQHMLEKELKHLDRDINHEAIRAIFALLPQNPRKFKHYLRYLSGLHKSFLRRFSREELDWKVLYLAQLLRLEYPNEFHIIVNDNEMINYLAGGFLSEKVRDRAFPDDDKQKPSWHEKIHKKFGNGVLKDERFLEIYGALVESIEIFNIQHLKNHLLVLEEPELLTWKEYFAFKNKLKKLSNDSILRKVKRFILKNKKAREIEKTRELIKTLVRERNTILGQVSDYDTQAEMKKGLVAVNEIMKICFVLLDIDELFSDEEPIFNLACAKEWISLLAHWAHFRKHKLYVPIRESEEKLLLKLVQKLQNQASTLLDLVTREFDISDIVESQKAFKPTYIKIIEILEKALSKELLLSFNKIDGIKRLWGKDKYIPEKRILFTNHPVFHNARNYEALKKIAKQAKTDSIIQKNFIEYMRMLFYSVLGEGMWVNRDKSIEVLKNKKFISIVWPGVIAQPLNRRLVGSLEEYRKKAIEKSLNDEKVLAVPKWWELLIADRK